MLVGEFGTDHIAATATPANLTSAAAASTATTTIGRRITIEQNDSQRSISATTVRHVLTRRFGRRGAKHDLVVVASRRFAMLVVVEVVAVGGKHGSGGCDIDVGRGVAFVDGAQIANDAHVDECEYERGREQNERDERRHVDLAKGRRAVEIAILDGLVVVVVVVHYVATTAHYVCQTAIAKSDLGFGIFGEMVHGHGDEQRDEPYARDHAQYYFSVGVFAHLS